MPSRIQFDEPPSSPADASTSPQPDSYSEHFRIAMDGVKLAAAEAKLIGMTYVDKARIAVRQTLGWVIFGVAAGVLGAGILATATVLFVIGLADAIGAATRPWAGKLIVGGVVLGSVLLVAWIVKSKISGSGWKGLRRRYAVEAEQAYEQFAERKESQP